MGGAGWLSRTHQLGGAVVTDYCQSSPRFRVGGQGLLDTEVLTRRIPAARGGR